MANAPDDVWTPEERADVLQMIRSHTSDAARALALHEETGSIEVGKSADLVVLNENILDVPAERIGFSWMGGGTTTVVRTVFQGRTVFTA